ncbi:NAD(P)-binding protein [Karstenula rhodostoma CBS 690.94]|uniref:NAD(P)-binding protein n=1 Tax=Karstenula rhodostoma CBS 690.94 TaxID=1392251 RepID=A0A9P4UIC5_9PLEO|nr:NAD(P)-binding protein [Karstenula rhodostoma CBS 690.94]
MPSTTYAEFGHDTEALEVAKAFADGIRGKTIIVTGANSGGIGYTTLQAFASQSPAHLILASRTSSKTQETVEKLKTEYPGVDYRPLILNLSSQKSVRDAAAEVLSWKDVDAIDIIVNSAGLMGLPERQLTAEGIEMHFGTNHIGHFLFTSLLMPKLIAAAQRNPRGATRVVNVSSLSPLVAGIRWSDVNFDKLNKDLPEEERPNEQMLSRWGFSDVLERSYVPLEGYNQSKAANVLFSIALSDRLYQKHGIVSIAVHPGIIQTELVRDLGKEMEQALSEMKKQGMAKYKTQGAGSSTSLTAALDPKLGEAVNEEKDGRVYGAYMIDCKISEMANVRACSRKEAERLWELSEKLVGEKFAW